MPIEQPQPWPAFAGWLSPNLPALNKNIVFRAFADLGICEMPPSSNRSGRIDTYNQRAGAPLGSYWCASQATAVYVDAGADVPPSARASCDTLRAWAKREGLWKSTALEGCLVIYGTPADAHHVGIIVRVSPYLISIEGNTAFSGFTTNGEAVLVKKVDTTRVLGYIHPRARKS
jgi:hypothetical protein